MILVLNGRRISHHHDDPKYCLLRSYAARGLESVLTSKACHDDTALRVGTARAAAVREACLQAHFSTKAHHPSVQSWEYHSMLLSFQWASIDPVQQGSGRRRDHQADECRHKRHRAVLKSPSNDPTWLFWFKWLSTGMSLAILTNAST